MAVFQSGFLSGIREKIFSRKKDETEESNAVGDLALDVCETDASIVIVSPLAGVKAEDIEIILENNTLTIRGERKNTQKFSLKRYITQECFWGKFVRSIVLPSNIQAEKIKANSKNGILKILIPKIPKIKTKTIEVQM